jgi:SagB-type dehydrogenase family enzyme
MRRTIIVVLFILILLFEIGSATATPIETTISQRNSIRTYAPQNVEPQQLLNLLQAACGYAESNRVLPKIGDTYSIVIFAVNASGSFKYTPETNLLSVWDTAVNRETIGPHLTQSWEKDANIVLILVWNQTKMSNQYFASAEAGCLVQNVYLSAVALNIAACCAGSFDSYGLQSDLKLANTMLPLLIIPIGIPSSEYPVATPDYNRMTGNLPPVQHSERSFTSALNNMDYSQAWSTQGLSTQELSQLLWSAYGYSSTGHRTTPSAESLYPLIVYLSNATGTYRYLAENHSITQIKAGDNRVNIATACGNQMWAANAPVIFLIAYDSDRNIGHYGDWYNSWVEVDAGCVVQQILLESSAIDLTANVVAKGFESWDGASGQTLRDALGIASSIIPLYILPVGHVIPMTVPTLTLSPTYTFTSEPTSVPTSALSSALTILIATSLVSAVAVIVGIIVYFKKHRH